MSEQENALAIEDLWRKEPLASARRGYQKFIDLCRTERSFRLTPLSEESFFALCFAIFGLHLLGQRELIEKRGEQWAGLLLTNLRTLRARQVNVPRDKPFRQLLTFTLSALAIIGYFEQDPVEDLVSEQIPRDLKAELVEHGVSQGAPQSGNQAMFLAIFLLHAKEILDRPVDREIETWVELHQKWMNRFGFWGPDRGMTHLQFQNGYHQYEILEYLGVDMGDRSPSLEAVSALADRRGQFAPYPGGGGCYDYDAVFMLTPHGTMPGPHIRELLERTADTILTEQGADGGFCESHRVRPRSLRNLAGFLGHMISALPNLNLFAERARYALAMQRGIYDLQNSHWTRQGYAWNQSNLWDAWFRMLALARIQCAVTPGAASHWGFINYPGIGFHPSAARL